VLLCFIAALTAVPAILAQPRQIDVKSVLAVRVYKGGVFSVLGHDHEIAASVAAGTVDASARQVELRVHAAAMQVRDPGASEKDRSEIQKTMLGSEVLDAERYPDIVFKSSSADPAGAGAWTVRGTLTLHGNTRSVRIEVRESDGHYIGTARLKQTDFGIKPIRVAGGAVRVKDEVLVQFDLQLAR
jgi:polyisoprenoid-binding protein YceI